MKPLKQFQILSLPLVLFLLLSLTGCQLTGVLNPKGIIAFTERRLLFDALALMLIVVIPVIIMSFAFVIRYRETHQTAEYNPNWGHSVMLETIWWGVPCVIILVLGIMTWKLTHKLDPYRPINSEKPLLIEAVALPWKWLFIYPNENIATVNFLELPVNRQVEFWITVDNVPMSAIFIPQLGSQIYAMAGMRTRLYLLSSHEGVYEGLNTQYNGDGFSEMHFTVKVVDDTEMKQWLQKIKTSSKPLNEASYEQLRQPSIAAPVSYYSSPITNLFNKIMKSYSSPTP